MPFPEQPSPSEPKRRGGPRGGPSRLVAVLGPTNTGKTHFAVERMLSHDSAMIGLPLRLLAREVYDRIVAKKGAALVALITGEEKIVPAYAQYFVCTVEAMPLERDVDCLAIDEIQLAADPERGHVFTARLLHARGKLETVFLGSETIKPLLQSLLPDTTIISRPRFSELRYAGYKKVSRLPRRSAVVAFSADNVYAIAELLRRQRGGAAVVLGALSPRTRNAQVALYQSGEVDFMVATDAIGMGLNMDVDHVAFAATRKFDGFHHRNLTPAEMGQIAGRAGRYLNDGTFGACARAEAPDADVIEQIERHRFDPLTLLQWRNVSLNFSSLQSLIISLEARPKRPGLARARPATDQLALTSLARDEAIRERATGPASVRLLWDVCQVPDFRNVMAEEHVRLLSELFQALTSEAQQIPEDWMARQVEKLDRADGDLDALSQRITHIRTLTFISNRPGWLGDASHWQERTRTIEDKLSDALHERLTQRFIDRRTSVLMRRLRENERLVAAVSKDGEVTVEGEFVGRLEGLRFVQDPRVLSGDGGLEAKTLRSTATKALEPELVQRARRIVESAPEGFTLRRDATLWWERGQIARLTKGVDALSPTIEVVHDELLPPTERDNVAERLQRWLSFHLKETLGPLIELKVAVNETAPPEGKPEVAGLARGVGFRLVEGLGALPRNDIAEDVKALDQASRGSLRKYGVRFGEFSVFMPALLKPAQAELLVLLHSVFEDRTKDGAPINPVTPGLTSAPHDPSLSDGFYSACGYRRTGPRVVRIDMLERLGELIRAERDGKKSEDKPANKAGAKAGAKGAGKPGAPPAAPGSGSVKPAGAADLWALVIGQKDAAPEGPSLTEAQSEAGAQTAEAGDASVPEEAVASPAEIVRPDQPTGETPVEEEVPGPDAAPVEAIPATPVGAESASGDGPAVEGGETTPTPETEVVPETEASSAAAPEPVETAAPAEGPSQTPPSDQIPPSDPAPADAAASPEDAPAQSEVTSQSEASGDTASEAKAPEASAAPPSEASPETGETAEKAGTADAAAKKPADIPTPPGAFRVTPAMMSLVGCGGGDFDEILKALGFRAQVEKLDEETEITFWRLPSRRQGGQRGRPNRRGGQGDGHTREGPGRDRAGRDEGGREGGGRGRANRRANGSGPDGDRPDTRDFKKGGPKPRGKGGKGGDRHSDGPKGGPRPGQRGGGRGKPEADKPLDPDSPFAVLASLKSGGKSE